MRKWWPLVAICTGAFMLLVDVTIVNVALPDMARQLHTTFPDLQWVIDLYALVLGALVLTVGSIADRLGRKRLYLAGLILFAASSLTCGLAPNVGVLIAARGVQGLGGAAMFATTMALISSTYTGRDRGVAFVTSAVVGKVMHRAHPRIFIGIGLAVVAVGGLAQAVIRTGSGWAVVIPGLVLVGIGAGLAMAPLSATAMSAVPWQQAGMAGGALSAFRQLGYAFGIAVLGEIFRGGLTRVAGPALAGPLGGGQAGAVIAGSPHLTTLVHRAFADGLDVMYLVAAGFAVLAVIVVFALVKASDGAPAHAPQAATAATSAEVGA